MAKVWLPLGGIAISAKSGSGKSTLFFGSEHVRHVLIADPGSQGHRLYHRGNGEIEMLDSMGKLSPIRQAKELISRWTRAGFLWLFDSFSAIAELEVAWMKHTTCKSAVSLFDHQHIVGNLRDLAVVASSGTGFTIFNTAPGGESKSPDGSIHKTPQGSLVGYPSLSGVGANSETILARWTTSWVLCPGGRDLPRGFFLPQNDLRPQATTTYTPIKDPMQILAPGVRRGDNDETIEVPVDPILPFGSGCTADSILERIAAKFPPPGASGSSQPSAAPTQAEPDRKVNDAEALEIQDFLGEHKLDWTTCVQRFGGKCGIVAGTPIPQLTFSQFTKLCAAMTAYAASVRKPAN